MNGAPTGPLSLADVGARFVGRWKPLFNTAQEQNTPQ